MTTDVPFPTSTPFEQNHVSRWIKRAVDVVVSITGLIVLSPIFVAIAASIRLDDGGAVFFTQIRSGHHAIPFQIWKFRSLSPQPPADETPTAREGVADGGGAPDARATRVGTFLRTWSLDELPQLWNVLRGDMSLVGPRPTLPEQVARYGPHEMQRLAMPPGLTGWAQIHGRNALSWPERIDLDAWYVDHWRPGLDLRILLKTPRVVLARTGIRGADGANPDFRPVDTPRTTSSSSSSSLSP